MADNAQILQLLTMSKISKVPAAQSMGLPEAFVLRVGLNTGIVKRRSKVNATCVGVHEMCGTQPELENFTTDADGKALHEKTPCFWQDSISCFEGSWYKFKNGRWSEIVVAHYSSTVQMLSQFIAGARPDGQISRPVYQEPPHSLRAAGGTHTDERT